MKVERSSYSLFHNTPKHTESGNSIWILLDCNHRKGVSKMNWIQGNAKIIDIALKYGYDTPESFSRAFTRFHGISPSEAKRGGKVKISLNVVQKCSVGHWKI